MSTDMDTTTPATTARATLRTYARPATVGWATVRDHVRIDGSQCPKSGAETTRRDGPDALPICIDGCPDSVDRRAETVAVTNAEFWADIAAKARANSTPANTEFEAHYLNERHDRARKAEKVWRGEITPETIDAAWDAAIAFGDARVERAAAIRDVIARKAAEAEIDAAARRVLALASVPPHEPADIDAFAAMKRAQYA